jgi:ketosteroid isomerase-like protein
MAVAHISAVAQAFLPGVANQDAAALADIYLDDVRLLAPNLQPTRETKNDQANAIRQEEA